MAFEGEVTDVRSYNGRPVLRLTVDEHSTHSRPEVLWVAYLERGQPVAVVGDRVRVLGDLDVDQSPKLASTGIPIDGPLVLSFAEANLTTRQVQHTDAARNQCKEWEQGQWPSSFLGAPVPRTALEPTGPFGTHGAYERGRLQATADVRSGILRIKSFGLPPPWVETYASVLKNAYAIDLQSLGCVVLPAESEYARGYNEVSERAIEERFGKGLLEHLSNKVEGSYEFEDGSSDDTAP